MYFDIVIVNIILNTYNKNVWSISFYIDNFEFNDALKTQSFLR
jgi:hypothetical protein